MIKRKFDSATYQKLGCPDIGKIMFFKKADKKVWGKIVLLSFIGFKGSRNGFVLLGLEPFKNK